MRSPRVVCRRSPRSLDIVTPAALKRSEQNERSLFLCAKAGVRATPCTAGPFSRCTTRGGHVRAAGVASFFASLRWQGGAWHRSPPPGPGRARRSVRSALCLHGREARLFSHSLRAQPPPSPYGRFLQDLRLPRALHWAKLTGNCLGALSRLQSRAGFHLASCCGARPCRLHGADACHHRLWVAALEINEGPC